MEEIKAEIVKCNTPQTMLLDMCKSCKRAKVKEGDETEMFQPVKKMFLGWQCDGYVNVNQGSLF